MQETQYPRSRVAAPKNSDGLGFFGKAALFLLISTLVLALGGAAYNFWRYRKSSNQ